VTAQAEYGVSREFIIQGIKADLPAPVRKRAIIRHTRFPICERTLVRIYLIGVSCVGKTTIGRRLAELLNIAFFDLDEEVEKFFGTAIERLQKKFPTMHAYRQEAAKALLHIQGSPDSRDSVIALPPSGLMGGYLHAMNRTTGIVVVLDDRPENILERIAFFDIDSKPLRKELTPQEKPLYLNEIKEDIACFGTTYGRAHLRVDISGLDVDAAAKKVKEAVESFRHENTP
jgi:shikimate kinase